MKVILHDRLVLEKLCLILRDYLSKCGGIAQLGEHLPCTQGVKGSNPFISTIYGSIAQLVRAHA